MASVLFIRGDIFERGADLTVLPCSAKGHISRTAEGHVHRFGMPLPTEKSLGEIEILPFPGAGRFTRYVAWAASVMNYKSSPETIHMIGKHLAEYANQHPKIQIIESPLLGTGAGELDPIAAGNALREGFMAKCHTGAALMIYGQQATIINSLRNGSAESAPEADITVRTPTPDFEYDVALSFAGEQREHARAIEAYLTARGIRVFFDEHHEANLWGKTSLSIWPKCTNAVRGTA